MNVEVGVYNESVNLIFPVLLTVTKEKPVCVLSLHFRFDDMEFDFFTNYPDEDDIGWYTHHWTNFLPEPVTDDIIRDYSICHKARCLGNNALIYQDVITPVPCELSKIIVY